MWVRFPPGTPADERRFDALGLRPLEQDWARWPGQPLGDLRLRSQFNLLYDIGHLSGKNSGQAMDYAMYSMEKRQRVPPVFVRANPELRSEIALTIEHAEETVPA
jgi:hypothetical protein